MNEDFETKEEKLAYIRGVFQGIDMTLQKLSEQIQEEEDEG